MVLLSRLVRFALHEHPSPATSSNLPHAPNGYGGNPRFDRWPTSHHIQVEVVCKGRIDPVTGYFLDIKAIDTATRDTLIPHLSGSLRSTRSEVQTLVDAVGPLHQSLNGSLVSLRWNLTPTYSIEVTPMPTTATLRQKFEIAAAHRLHVPGLSDAENRRLFGKCASPGGHGHNYIIEPAVAVALAATPPFTLADLERATTQAIIDPFDHKNLNSDCPQFDQSNGGVNPSVENISRVFHDLLKPAIDRPGATLISLTVWETEKTSSTYPA